MPSFGAWGFQDAYKDLLPQGARNFGGIIATMISNPIYTIGTLLTAEKLRYALQILLPVALLPVRRRLAGRVDHSRVDLHVADDRLRPDDRHRVPVLRPLRALRLRGGGARPSRRTAPRGWGWSGAGRRCARWSPGPSSAACSGAPSRRATLVHGGFSMMPMRAPTRGRAPEAQGPGRAAQDDPEGRVGRDERGRDAARVAYGDAHAARQATTRTTSFTASTPAAAALTTHSARSRAASSRRSPSARGSRS